MNIILKWLVMAAAILISAYMVPNVSIAGFWSAIWLALFLGIVNMVIRPLLLIITLPINIFTLGLFTFVINALMILLASSVVKGFAVKGFWIAMLFSIVLSIVSYILNSIFIAKK